MKLSKLEINYLYNKKLKEGLSPKQALAQVENDTKYQYKIKNKNKKKFKESFKEEFARLRGEH